MTTRCDGVVLGFFLTFLAACPRNTGGNDAGATAGGGDAGAAATGPWVTYCDHVAAAYCDAALTCGDTDSSALAACVTHAKSACTAALRDTAANGASAFPANAEHECLAALERGCRGLTAAFDYECLVDAFEGHQRPEGAACVDWTQCNSGCTRHDSTQICGVCSADSTPPCGGACDGGTYCDGINDTCLARKPDGEQCFAPEQCLTGVCRPYARICGLSEEGGDCGGEWDCAPTHSCHGWNPEPTTSGTCERRVDAGAPCTAQPWDSTAGCELGSWCLDGVCQTPDAGSRAEGAACSRYDQCAAGGCLRLETLSFGTCVNTALGGPCFDDWWCAPGSLCINSGDGGACMARAGLHAPCAVDLDGRYLDNCFEGLVCNAQLKTCEPLGAIGAPCSAHFECLGLNCAASKCRAPAPGGASCGGNAGCASGSCDDFDSFTRSGTCHAVCK